MENTFKAIEATKAMIARQVNSGKYFFSGPAFEGYQSVYFNTNENIKETLEKSEIIRTKSALTILGSGDQFFNLVSAGFSDIDTFDTNLLTEYFTFGLKYAMIKKYSYYEYIRTMNILSLESTNIHTITQIIWELLPYMDDKYRIFWQSIVEYNCNIQRHNVSQLNLIYMLFIQFNNKTLDCYNNFLCNEETYNNLKQQISKVSYSFKSANGIKYTGNADKKYDYIHLSNIVDYFYRRMDCNWNKKELVSYIERWISRLDDEGILMFKYCFLLKYSDYQSQHLIDGCDIITDDIPYIEVKPISTVNEKVSHGAILVRK